MSPLASLVRAYDRMAARGEVPKFGYARTEVDFCVVIDRQGCVPFAPVDLQIGEGKKRVGRRLDLPTPLVQRTSGIAPNFLWDKTAYSLGITEGDGRRTAKEHQAFVDMHRRLLNGSKDPGLIAFLAFLNQWNPDKFDEAGWSIDMRDANIVFALHDEYHERFIHDREEAKAIWLSIYTSAPASLSGCLLTGETARVARSHPPIKGVWGSQSSGAFIVSYNATAFTSYEHNEGDNAPVSEGAAFAYTSALNHFLERGSTHRLQVADASTVFWADASDALDAMAAESVFRSLIDEKQVEAVEENKVKSILAKLQDGRPIEDFKPDLPQGVRFFVLGLAPNAARLSVRFYIEEDFGVIAERYLKHLKRLRIDPPPKEEAPSMWRMLIETAVLRKSDNIQPNLAGEWMRAILMDAPYPFTLLSTLIMRLRADHDVNALRVAMLKSILIKNFKMEVPVSLDPECKESGYLLGRLFAVYEQIQVAALGRSVNATIKDKYYGAAAAQPRKVFRMLESGSSNHLSKIGKQKPGLKVNLEKAVGAIMETMSPDQDPFPASLPDKSQALFGLGYYHQRNEFFRKPEKPVPGETA
jgi:CRISPR-associated protein Csd1